MLDTALECCVCPYCGSSKNKPWATESGFGMVECVDCNYLFVNPRPNSAAREKATQLGVHGSADDMNISERYVPRKTAFYKAILKECFPDMWARGAPITWLDIGAGYGEVMDAVAALAPPGSKIVGLEPMIVKAKAAQQRGLM